MLCCLFLVILHFSTIRNPLTDLSLSEFPLSRKKSKSYILDCEVIPARYTMLKIGKPVQNFFAITIDLT